MAPSLSSAKPTKLTKCARGVLSIQDSKVCYGRKKIALNDEEEATIAEFESDLKEMNVTKNMSELEQTLLIRKYNTCYKRLNNEKGLAANSICKQFQVFTS
jgi:hypothetical protein